MLSLKIFGSKKGASFNNKKAGVGKGEKLRTLSLVFTYCFFFTFFLNNLSNESAWLKKKEVFNGSSYNNRLSYAFKKLTWQLSLDVQCPSFRGTSFQTQFGLPCTTKWKCCRKYKVKESTDVKCQSRKKKLYLIPWVFPEVDEFVVVVVVIDDDLDDVEVLCGSLKPLGGVMVAEDKHCCFKNSHRSP